MTRSISLLSAALLLTLAAAPCRAQESQRALTQESIKKFYDDTFDMQQKDPGSFVQFMKDHTSADAQFIMHSSTHIQGQVPQENTQTFGKEEMANTLVQSLQTTGIDKIKYSITSINIAADGKTATVTDESSVDSKIRASNMGVMTHSTCQDSLAVSQYGIIQMTRSECQDDSYVTQNSN